MTKSTATQPRTDATPAYLPKKGDTITVELPDERTRATVEKVVSPTSVIAKLDHYTTAKASHSYKKGDLIACKFEMLGMTVPGWRVVSQRELDEGSARHNAKKPKKR